MPTTPVNVNPDDVDIPSNGSFLSYAPSQTFRENLILLNLKPYNIDGINSEPQGSITYQQTLPDLSSPEILFPDDGSGTPVIRNDTPGAKVIASTYTAYNILKSTNIQGTPGSIAEDSYLAKIGVQVLKDLLLETNVGYLKDEISNQNSVSFKITTPDTNDTFESKLEGSYQPTSPIPGDYFLDGLNGRATDTLGEAINLIAGRSTTVGGLFNGSLTRQINPSQIFLQNTNDGQKGILFSNLSYNIYRPAYSNSIAGGLLGNLLTTGVNNLLDNFGLQLPGAYYVGSVTSEPSYATSPINAVPIDAYGRDTQAPVYGPDVLAKDYEGNIGKLNFGLQSGAVIDQGNLESNFIWVSPKYKAGQSKFYSTAIPFKPGSILDDTQRLVESADRLQGEQRFKHVGNAINQVSKIFNDGYKQITKGSQVVTYKDPLFEQKVGEEYCRVFTKADTYSTYDRLQKPEGISGYGRRFQNTILDNTYNLNIVPLKGQNSTNVSGGSVKKYMFSLENLAWRSGARKGYSYEDLPDCEKGPNGGRIMWFPPYGLTFNDSSTANWDEKAFLGRPEPIYTYKNTSRNGSLTWKIVVDHPSVLNILVNKVLANETPINANKMLESFFAGCQKYDLYDLASKYGTVNRTALQEIQKILTTSPAEYADIRETITIQPSTPAQLPEAKTDDTDTQTANLNKYIGLGFYFDNNIPPPSQGITADGPYNSYYDDYIGKKDIYLNKAKNNKEGVGNFFDQVIKYNFDTIDKQMAIDLSSILKEGNQVIIDMEGSASASASDEYNLNLSKRRINSVIQYFRNYSLGGDPEPITFSKYIDDGTLKINETPQGEMATNVSAKGLGDSYFESSTCTTNPTYESGPKSGQKMTDTDAIYTTESMACRSVRFMKIEVVPVQKLPDVVANKPAENKTTGEITTEERVTGRKITKEAKTTTTENLITRPGLSKRVLRDLLTECDYFEVLKQEDPFVYDELRKKLKVFSPSFHSITPEGLNSRLTFLNQCVRPGDTIPVIGEDGLPKYNDSVNTAFGAPPVLVLRVGDFYNTKIIPKSLQITYEQVYDMNPEGIGFQPMIANVTLSFDFIGGQGLARPVEDLQNALSFNYYANTEIYDERSVATEDVTKLDALIDEKKKINTEIKPSTPPNIQENAVGKTIGNITSNILGKTSQTFSDVTETGRLSYRELMKQIVDQSQTYFGSVISKLTSLSESYNYGIVRTITTKRKYIKGLVASADTVMLFGKCSETQQQMNKLIDDVKNDITVNNNTIIKFYEDKGFSLSGTVITTIKTNMLNYVESMRQDFVNGIDIELEQLYSQELSLISSLDKMNIIFSNIDGKVLNSGEVIVYNLTGDSQTDLKSDYDLMPTQYQDFLQFIYGENILSQPDTAFVYTSDILLSEWEQRFFMLMSKIFLDKNNLEAFKKVLLPDGDVIGGNKITVPRKPEDVMNKILGLRFIDAFDFNIGQDSMHENFTKEQKNQNKKYNLKTRAAVKYNKYVNFFNPFNKLSNKRELDYIKSASPTDVQKQKFLDLASTLNTGDQNKFNGKKKFN
jgi:hypothetical protein